MSEERDVAVEEVVYVTEENIQEFTIADVVMPLPGFSVKYPKNSGR